MSTDYGAQYRNISSITGPSGFYGVRVGNQTLPVYVDQDYDGGGWVCVLANRQFTAGMRNLTQSDAINKCNYRSEPSSDDGTNTVVRPDTKNGSLSDYNIWVGLKYWFDLAGRENSGKVTIVQFVSNTIGCSLGNTTAHTKRYRWSFDSWNSEYAFVGAAAISDETGTGSPGMYGYHAQNTDRGITTFDLDNDQNGGNCSTYYNNNPWWYGSCWSGNYFAGGGYQDKPYWNSSGSDNHAYGAVYIK